MEGLIFGRLKVLKDSGQRHNTTRNVMWECVCNCGNTILVASSYLTKGSTKSCGCLRKEVASKKAKNKHLKDGEAGFNALRNSYKCRARKRGITFSLSNEEFAQLCKSNCNYCGAEPSQVYTGMGTTYSDEGKEHSSYIYNGLDRIDSSIGYEISNVVACCKYCNRAKNDMSLDKFKEWLQRAAAITLRV